MIWGFSHIFGNTHIEIIEITSFFQNSSHREQLLMEEIRRSPADVVNITLWIIFNHGINNLSTGSDVIKSTIIPFITLKLSICNLQRNSIISDIADYTAKDSEFPLSTILIHTWNPNDPFWSKFGPSFGVLKPQNKGHLQVPGIHTWHILV